MVVVVFKLQLGTSSIVLALWETGNMVKVLNLVIVYNYG